MKISEVEKITGLTQKAIRLYEKNGFIKVARSSNEYRSYDMENVEKLKEIKLFRRAGIGLGHIRMWADGVVTADELIKKRMSEIDNESDISKQQYTLCSDFLKKHGPRTDEDIFDESEEGLAVIPVEGGVLGIDIGTTSISASVVDLKGGKELEAFTIYNGSDLVSDAPFKKEQNPEVIYSRVMSLVSFILKTYPGIVRIGFTGQMHGILYTDKNGNSVSPLYTWQDGRGEEIISGTTTYCERIKEITGKNVSTGFGFATHYYNVINRLVPEKACSMCTIMDYCVMKLCGLKKPVIHPSNAASFGLYDFETNSFAENDIKALGMTDIELPVIAEGNTLAGSFNGVDVYVAIGDNQASFFGSVKDEENTVLVNFGTGSQISLVGDLSEASEAMEARPYGKGTYILSGSALCGGRAYAIVERFFSAFAEALGVRSKKQYELMNSLAERTLNDGNDLKMNTTFCGTRKNPDETGSLTNISEANFTPGGMILATLRGMAEELYNMYPLKDNKRFTTLVASGNAVRKNTVLQKVLSDIFGMEVKLTSIQEEAAFGAALWTSIEEKDIKSVKECITYI